MISLQEQDNVPYSFFFSLTCNINGCIVRVTGILTAVKKLPSRFLLFRVFCHLSGLHRF